MCLRDDQDGTECASQNPQDMGDVFDPCCRLYPEQIRDYGVPDQGAQMRDTLADVYELIEFR